MGIRPTLSALAAGLLALGTGCVSADSQKSEAKKPDVTQPGVLPPPQAMARTGANDPVGGPVVQASATTPVAPTTPAAPAGALPAAMGIGPSFSKMTAKMERKVLATEMAVGWQNRIAYLPDPVRAGRMSPGIAGQMFLFGGAKLEFAQADGTLTVDLLDETPRPAGQPAATPERWQFDKATLRNLQTKDETFGRSYVLFLPWPAYKSDITRVRISARYDPDNGHTLYAPPSTITIDTSAPLGAPVWSEKTTTTGTTPPMGNRPQQFGPASMPGMGGFSNVPAPGAVTPLPGALAPIPLGGAAQPAPLPGAMLPLPNATPPAGVMPMMPLPPSGASSLPPAGAMPVSPAPPERLPSITLTLPSR